MVSKPISQITSSTDTDTWILTSEQMLFMLQHNNAIETAFDRDDMDFFKALVMTSDYLQG